MEYTIKEHPEDFIVREKSTVKIEENGAYSYFLMKKRDYTTVKAVETIAKASNSRLKDFGFAGSKDRRALTEQTISYKGDKKRIEGLKLDSIELKFLGKGNNPISLGDLEGNEFEIIVSNAEKKPKPLKKFLNLFGEQRFSRQNVEVGRAIVNKDFEKACSLLDLEIENNDFVGELRKINRKILQIYVHAYQSFIWNLAVVQYAKEKNDDVNEKIPIPGFGTDLDGRPGEIIEKIMEEEGITGRDFIIRKIPELSAEGDERLMFVEVKNLEIKELKNKKIKLKFFLNKGSYATEFIRQAFQ